MKDIILLIKQRKDFYLTALVLTLLLTIIGAFYNLSVISKEKTAVLDTNIMNETQLEAVLVDNEALFQNGLSSEGLMNGFFNNYTYMGYTGISLFILIVMILSCANFTDYKTKEFLETLPVKRVALESYNYVALMGILLANIVVVTVIHLVHFHHYNQKIIDLAECFPGILGTVVPQNLVSVGDGLLLYQFGMVALFLMTITTFCFMFGTLFKKSWVGVLIGFWLWHSMGSFLYDVRWEWIKITNGDPWGDIPESFRNVVAVFEPKLYFSRFKWMEGTWTNAFTPYVISVLVVMLIVMIGILVFHAYCRELSKGKIFYANCINIVLLVFAGFYIFIKAMNWWGSPKDIVLATIVTVVAEIVAITFIYRKKTKTYKLAVKEVRKGFNPLVAQKLPGWAIAAGVTTWFTLVIDWDWSMHSLFMWADDSMNWFPGEPFYLTHFALEYRYHFAMIIIAGFIIYKCIRFAMEGPKARREFMETLPMSKARTFYTKLLMDMCLIIVPLAIFTAVSVGYFVAIRNKMLWAYPEVEMYDMVGEQFAIAWVVLCIAVFFMGVMYLIDAVTVNGGMKIMFFGVAALLGGTIFVMIIESNSTLFRIIAEMTIMGSSTLFTSIIFLMVGMGMLIASGILYGRRDAAKEIFYFKPVKYVFAAMLSIEYLIFVFAAAYTEQAFYQYLLAIIGTVLIYFMTIYYCTPGRMSELRQKVAGKKAVK